MWNALPETGNRPTQRYVSGAVYLSMFHCPSLNNMDHELYTSSQKIDRGIIVNISRQGEK